MLRKSLTTVVVVGGLLAVASVGIASRDDSNPPGSDVAQVAAIEPEAKDALAVLETTRTSVDALPGDVTEYVDEQPDFGMNPDLSRLSIGNTTNSVYVIPARDHVCASLTVGQGANFNCRSTEELADGEAGPATVTVEGNGIAIYGLVPDGVESVAVGTGVSESTDVPVENNAYYTVVPGGTPVRTVSYEGPSGPVEFPIYDPALAFEEQ